MHETSYLKMTAFRDCYLQGPDSYRVLDVGSRAHRNQDSYRPIFNNSRFEYVGLDIEPGPNVDIVPRHAYRWTELESDSIDAVISGQVFEHNPFFWITIAEIARVVRPGGYICIVAPSKGRVHRHPLDCWRFYPDAATAIFAYVGIELIESYVEQPSRNKVIDTRWGDMLAIGRKPQDIDMERLRRIVALAPETLLDFHSFGRRTAIEQYELQVRVSKQLWFRDQLMQTLRQVTSKALRIFRQ